MSLRDAVLNMKGSAGHNMEKYAIFSTQIGHTVFDDFLYFNDQISNFVGLKESRGPH
jgi:hypothetical protein